MDKRSIPSVGLHTRDNDGLYVRPVRGLYAEATAILKDDKSDRRLSLEAAWDEAHPKYTTDTGVTLTGPERNWLVQRSNGVTTDIEVASYERKSVEAIEGRRADEDGRKITASIAVNARATSADVVEDEQVSYGAAWYEWRQDGAERVYLSQTRKAESRDVILGDDIGTVIARVSRGAVPARDVVETVEIVAGGRTRALDAANAERATGLTKAERVARIRAERRDRVAERRAAIIEDKSLTADIARR